MAYSTGAGDVKFDSKLQAVWKKITSDRDPVNWCIAKYDEKKNLCELEDSGDKGLQGFKARVLKNAGKIQFGGFSVVATDKTTKSRRVRFVFVTYNGGGNMQKFKMTYLTKEIGDKLFNGAALSLDFNAGTISDLTEKAVAKRLISGTGGHKPTHFEFSKEVEISVESLGSNVSVPSTTAAPSSSPKKAFPRAGSSTSPKAAPAPEPEAAPQPVEEAPAEPEPAPVEEAPQAEEAPAAEETPAEPTEEAPAATEDGGEYTYNQ